MAADDKRSIDRNIAIFATAMLHGLAIFLWGSWESEPSGQVATNGVGNGGTVMTMILMSSGGGALNNDAQSKFAVLKAPSTMETNSSGEGLNTAESLLTPIATEIATTRNSVSADEDPSVDQAVAMATPQTSPGEGAISDTSSGGGGGRNVKDDLAALYRAAVRASILRQWQLQTDEIFPIGCSLKIDQSFGGIVKGVQLEDCSLGGEQKKKVERAVLRAQPLPFAGFESVFDQNLVLKL